MDELSCEEDLFCGVNKPKDHANMNDLEKKHTPVIDAPASVKNGELFEVTVEVGKLLKHPNEIGHFIQWVELYQDKTFLARSDFVAELTEPKVRIPVRLVRSGMLRAFERCNLHGTWEGSKEIKVR